MRNPAYRTDRLFFANNDREWVRRKWATVRDYHQKADKANARYRQISDELNNYLDRSGITDIIQRAKIRMASLPLQEALSDGQWFRKEADAHANDLHLYIKLKEVGLL